MLKKIGGAVVAVAPFSAYAAAPVLTTLTDAVDWSTTSAAILAISAGIIVVYIGWKAAKMVIRAVKSA